MHSKQTDKSKLQLNNVQNCGLHAVLHDSYLLNTGNAVKHLAENNNKT